MTSCDTMADMQTIMKAQAELSYINERLQQIHQNRPEQGYDKHEYEVLMQRKAQLLAILNRRE
ncbi:MAG: hypothetical protein OWQ34_02205 [Thermoplasma acidophilum]|nr:hypothetical protein [Thermoplasma acidophilum]